MQGSRFAAWGLGRRVPDPEKTYANPQVWGYWASDV